MRVDTSLMSCFYVVFFSSTTGSVGDPAGLDKSVFQPSRCSNRYPNGWNMTFFPFILLFEKNSRMHRFVSWIHS